MAPDFEREPPAVIVNAVPPNAYAPPQTENTEAVPLGTSENTLLGSRALIEKYGMKLSRRPGQSDVLEGAATIGYAPSRHFGTFLDELRALDDNGGEEAVRTVRCHS